MSALSAAYSLADGLAFSTVNILLDTAFTHYIFQSDISKSFVQMKHLISPSFSLNI